MKRETFIRGMVTGAVVMAFAAIAIFLFTPIKLENIMSDGQFWFTLSGAGVGGFIGSLFRRKSKVEQP